MKKRRNLCALKGNIVYSKSLDCLEIFEKGYLVYEGNKIEGVYPVLPDEYEGILVEDYGDRLIVPGFVDLHVHAPQYSFRGLGMNLELIDWLNTHTFVEEAKYSDLEYAELAYDIFVEDLLKGATTRACVFATIHTEATMLLVRKLEAAGIRSYVGRINMDRNCPEYLCEESAQKAAEDTEMWIKESEGFKNVKTILTPRFVRILTWESR